MAPIPENLAYIKAVTKLSNAAQDAVAYENILQEMEASSYLKVRRAAEKVRLPHENEDGTYINLPANFPFKSDAELAAVDYLRGVRFLYKSKYGGELTLTVRNALVVTQYALNEENKLYIKSSDVSLVTDKSSYEWEYCTLLED